MRTGTGFAFPTVGLLRQVLRLIGVPGWAMCSRAPHRRGASLSTPPIFDRADNLKMLNVDTPPMGTSVPTNTAAVVMADVVNGLPRLKTTPNGLFHDKTMDHLRTTLVDACRSHVSLNHRRPKRSQQTIPTGHRSLKGKCNCLTPSTGRTPAPRLRTEGLELTTTHASKAPMVFLASTNRTGRIPDGVDRLLSRHDEKNIIQGCVMTYC